MPTWLKAAPCRKRVRTGWQALYPGGCWVSGGWLMSPAPFPVVAECEYQQPCHRQRHADQQPQAWRVCTRVGQLRRFTVQNGKGHGVGVIVAWLKRFITFLNFHTINRTRAVLGKLDLNWLCQQVVPRMCLGFRQAVCTGFQICERIGDFAVFVRCGGNGTCVCAICAIEYIGSIYLLRFSFGCWFDQLFQLELNIFQEHILALIIGFRVLLDDIQCKLRVLQLVGQLNLAAAAGDGSIGGCGLGVLCAISIADFCFRFSRYNKRIAFNRNGFVRLYLGKLASLIHRTFHNAVHIIGLTVVSIDLVLIQTAKGIQPAVICMVNRNIFAARGRVVNNIPRGILSTVCQAALELDVNLVRLVRCSKVLTICIFPELIELNVDQCALGVGKDCGKFRIATITPSTMVLPISWAEWQLGGTVTLCSLEPSLVLTSSMV